MVLIFYATYISVDLAHYEYFILKLVRTTGNSQGVVDEKNQFKNPCMASQALNFLHWLVALH